MYYHKFDNYKKMEQEIRQSLRTAHIYTPTLQIYILTLTVIDRIRHLENIFIYHLYKRNKQIKMTKK